MHCNYGIDLVNTIKLENPHLWTRAFREEMQELFRQAVELEYRYAEDTMPRGVLGLNAPMFKEYLRFIANRRCQQIGLETLYPGAQNPFPWMSEMIDLKKERNFFETRVIEYQTGGALNWEGKWKRSGIKCIELRHTRPRRTTSCGCASRMDSKAPCSSATCSRSARSGCGATCASSRR